MSTQQTTTVATPTQKQVRLAIASGAFGTAVEFYDFFIYGTAAALVLNQLFFPNVSPAIGTLAAFATFGVGFLFRPVGAVIFGYFGDRHGRKRALIVSLLLMGLATFAIGCLPTFNTIGIWAPILLVALRATQGVALGGEWSGAAVLASEYAAPKRRAFMTSFVQMGSPLGLLASSAAFALVGLGSPEWVQAWGWRVPFWVALPLVTIGLFIRMRVDESPEFKRATAAGEMSTKAPLVEVFKYSGRELLIAICLRFAPDIGFYMAATFMVSYAVGTGHFVAAQILAFVAMGAALEIILLPFFGRLSDRIGRKKVYVAGVLVWIIVAFPLIAAVTNGNAVVAAICTIAALSLGHGLTYSVAPALYSELFPTRYRTTGAAVALNFSNIVAGGPAPLIAAFLVLSFGAGWPVSIYLAAAGLLSLIAALVMAETRGRNLAEDYSTRPIDKPVVGAVK